jgi:hypothetical protein
MKSLDVITWNSQTLQSIPSFKPLTIPVFCLPSEKPKPIQILTSIQNAIVTVAVGSIPDLKCSHPM